MVKKNSKFNTKKNLNFNNSKKQRFKNMNLETRHIKEDMKKQKSFEISNGMIHSDKDKLTHKKIIKKNENIKKLKIELNSKLKKKINSTKKILKFDDEKVDRAIKYIISNNEDLRKKFNKEFYNNFYAYLIFKNSITEDIDSFEVQEFKDKTKKYSKFEIEKVGDLNDPLVINNDKKKIKNFFFKLPVNFMNDKNNLKILLVNHDTEKPKASKNNNPISNTNKRDEIKDNKNSPDLQNYQLVEKLMENKFKEIEKISQKNEEDYIKKFENIIDIKSEKDFIEILKSSRQKINLNFLYKIFICNEKIKSRINHIFQAANSKVNSENSSKTNFFNSYDDLVDMHFINYGKNINANLDNMNLSLNICAKRSLVKNLNNKIFKIKFSNCSNTEEEIKRNLNYLAINLTSFILAKSNKYNNLKAIVIKSENSVPLIVHGELDIAEIEYFNF